MESNVALVTNDIVDQYQSLQSFEFKYQQYLNKYYLYELIYGNLTPVDCKNISIQCRSKLNYISGTLSYGEILYESFGSFLLHLIDLNIDISTLYHFVDIGSGSGKGIFCAALLGVFEKCTGIEILPDLYKISIQALNKYNKAMNVNANNNEDRNQLEINFIHGDATYINIWKNADIIFLHGTCFDNLMMSRIFSIASYLKEKSLFISISNKLPITQNLFDLIGIKSLEVTWGIATVYIYIRNDIKLSKVLLDPKLKLTEVLTRQVPI